MGTTVCVGSTFHIRPGDKEIDLRIVRDAPVHVVTAIAVGTETDAHDVRCVRRENLSIDHPLELPVLVRADEPARPLVVQRLDDGERQMRLGMDEG